MSRAGLITLASMALAGCTEAEPEAASFAPDYKGIETRLLADDMVSFQVAMEGARTKADVARYSECAAAQYALIRGYGFARHVRTNITPAPAGGTWRGDAVYLISASLPKGLKTLDAEVVAADCAENEIPMV